MKRIFAVLVITLVGCGGSPDWTCQGGDLCPDNIEVKMSRVQLRTVEVQSRLSTLIERSLSYWQLSPDALDGWRIEFVDAPFECAGVWAVGCNDRAQRLITVALSNYPPLASCVEETPLIHEIGHLRDPTHTDPLWCGMDAVYHSFAGTPECPGIENVFEEPPSCYASN